MLNDKDYVWQVAKLAFNIPEKDIFKIINSWTEVFGDITSVKRFIDSLAFLRNGGFKPKGSDVLKAVYGWIYFGTKEFGDWQPYAILLALQGVQIDRIRELSVFDGVKTVRDYNAFGSIEVLLFAYRTNIDIDIAANMIDSKLALG